MGGADGCEDILAMAIREAASLHVASFELLTQVVRPEVLTRAHGGQIWKPPVDAAEGAFAPDDIF